MSHTLSQKYVYILGNIVDNHSSEEPGRRLACDWFLEITFVRDVCMCACVCVCVRPRGY